MSPATLTVEACAALRGDDATYADSVNADIFASGTVGAGAGSSTGTLNVDRLTLSSSGVAGTLFAQIGPAGAYDKIQTIGAVDLSGASLNITLAPGYVPDAGDTFDLIHLGIFGTISGTFAGYPDQSVVPVGGQFFRIDYSSTGYRDVILTALPSVAAVEINDGSAQRSEVRSITVTFNGQVSFANGDAAAAFELTHLQTGIDVKHLQAAVSTDSQGRTVVTLTFVTTDNLSTEIDPISAMPPDPSTGLPTPTPSLADGRYQLVVFTAKVTGTGGAALNGGSQNYISPSDTYQGSGLHLYRIFGDGDGNGVVDATDLSYFRSTFNYNWTDAEFLAYFDCNNSGAVDASDLGQFRSRFNQNVF